MAISGLVVTLTEDPGIASAALSSLASDPRLTMGDQFGRRVAVVADTPSVQDDRALWDELRMLPGVTFVDVTFVHLDTDPDASQNGDRHRPVEDPHAHG